MREPVVAEKCSVEICERLAFAATYCGAHYARKQRGVDVNVPIQVKKKPRFINWHGDADCGASGAHGRVRKLWGAASQYLCVTCQGKALHWAYDGTDPTQLYSYGSGPGRSSVFYSRYPEFYMPMCARCHLGRDKAGAQKELEEYRTLKHRFGITYGELVDVLSRSTEPVT